jgi:membrane protein implicated in regulation of membrane protease activity
MVRGLRQVGIVLGSFVAAVLCVGMVGSGVMFLLGSPPSPVSGVIATIASVVLGWLIYRDIVRRERPAA